MKNKLIFSFKEHAKQANRITLRNIILIILLVTVKNNQVSAQKSGNKIPFKVGGGLELVSSGNWHGTLYSPFLSMNRGRNVFYGGALIQKRSSQFVGGRFGYSVNLSDPKIRISEEEMTEDYYEELSNNKCLIHLNFFSYAQYLNNAGLSYIASKTEQLTHKDGTTNWNKVKLNTAEVCMGFELNIRITERVTWKNFVGGSVYYHLNYLQGMYHDRVAPTLVLGTGIHICPL